MSDSHSFEVDSDNSYSDRLPNEKFFHDQLDEIYRFCSNCFKKEIDSPKSLFETISILIHDIKIITKENSTMRAILIKNNLLDNDESESTNKNYSNSSLSDSNKLNSKKSQKHEYKNHIIKLQQQVNTQEAIISDYYTKIQELKLNLHSMESQNAKNEQEIIKLTNKLKSNSNFRKYNQANKNNEQNNDLNDDENQINNSLEIEATVSLFEDVIKTQSEEIISLSDQRDQMATRLHLYNQILSQFDTDYQTLEGQKNALFSSLTTAKAKVKELESVLPNVIDEIHKLEIPYPLISKSDNLHDFIIETLTNIVQRANELSRKPFNFSAAQNSQNHFTNNNENTNLDNDNTCNNNRLENEDDFVSKEKYELVLKQLERSVKFLQNIANTNQIKDDNDQEQSTPLYKDTIARSLLLTQCARLSHFINNNNFYINSNPQSIFDTKMITDSNKILKPLLENASEEVMSRSPTREIYAFFIGVCEVNKMLLNYIENIEKGNKEASTTIQRDDDEYEQLLKWKDEYENQLHQIAAMTGMNGCPLHDVLNKFVDVYVDTVQENQELQNDLLNAKKDASSEIPINDSFNAMNDEIIDGLKQQNQHLEAIISENDLKHQSEIENLQKLIQKYKNKSKSLKEIVVKLSNAITKKEKKYIKAKELTDDMKKIAEEIDSKVSLVSEENQRLNENIEEMGEVLKKQNIELAKYAQKIQKLHEQKEFLKERLQESESNNASTLSSIKKRSESLNDKYSSTIEALQNDLKETREQLFFAESELKNVTKQKNELSTQLVKLRVNERALKIKLDAVESRNSLSRRENENAKSALIQSIKSETNVMIEKARSEFEKLKNSLVRILDEICKIKFIDNNPSSEELIKKLENCLHQSYDSQMTLKDTYEARLILGIPESQTLTVGAREVTETLKKLTKQNAEFRAQSEMVRRRCAEVDIKRNEQERAIRNAAEWENWSKSILLQITDGTAVIQSIKDVRFLLEEALLSSIAHRGILTRLEILKAEKKLFRNFGNFNKFEKNSRITSIRPIMVAIMSTRRLQVISHRLPIKLATHQRRDEFNPQSSILSF